MRPQRFALCVLRCTLVVAAEAAVAVAAVMVMATVVVLLVVEESHGTILGLKIARFRRFLKRRNGHTDGQTFGRTYRHTDSSMHFLLSFFGNINAISLFFEAALELMIFGCTSMLNE